MDFSGLRVYFAANGIGLGHVSRDIPIAKKIEAIGGKVRFSTFLEGVVYLKKRGFTVRSAPPLTMINDETGKINLRLSGIKQGVTSPLTFMRQVKFEIREMKKFNPDIVLADSRLSSIYAAKILDIPIVSILNQFSPIIPREEDNSLFRVADASIMTLLGSMWAWSDLILIPDFPEPYTISLDTLRIPHAYNKKVKYIGPIIEYKSDECEPQEKIREYYNVFGDSKLIFASISGPIGERNPLMKLLEPIFKTFSADITVIMSMGTPSGGSKLSHSGSLIKTPWLLDRFSTLNACDAVVNRGGHETIMQNICYEKPSLIIPVPNHPEQYGNAKRAKYLGIAEMTQQTEVTKETCLEILQELLSQPSYRLKLKQMKTHSDQLNSIDECLRAVEAVI